MPKLTTARTGLDSFIYWTIFIGLSCFVVFFLNQMIEFASVEDRNYENSAQINAVKMRGAQAAAQSSASSSNNEEVFSDGFDETAL